MINPNMRSYDYFTFGEVDAYGQPTLSETPKGKIKMSIFLLSKNNADNVLFENANYVGLTMQKVDDTFVINYGTEKLKVQYVNPNGRYNQVYLCRLG